MTKAIQQHAAKLAVLDAAINARTTAELAIGAALWALNPEFHMQVLGVVEKAQNASDAAKERGDTKFQFREYADLVDPDLSSKGERSLECMEAHFTKELLTSVVIVSLSKTAYAWGFVVLVAW